MRKKILILFLTIISAVCLCIGISACGGTGSNSSDSGNTSQSQTADTGGSSSDNTGDSSNNSSGDEEDTTPSVVTYTVIYDANGGTFADGSDTYTQTVNSGSTLTVPTSPTREGCTFAGWTTSKNGSAMWSFSSDTVTANITLYASWNEKTASILSVDNASIDGENIFMFVDSSDSLSLSSMVTCSSDSTWKLYYDELGQTEIPTRKTGTLSDGDNYFYIVVTSTDDTIVNSYVLDIYVSYAVNVKYYNGNSLLKTEIAYTGYTFDTDYTPSIIGYTFNYWKTTSSGNTKYTAATLWADLRLYADKTANNYTVTYDVNGGDELTETTDTVTYDSSYTLIVPTRTNYTFIGWYLDNTQLTNNVGASLSAWNYSNDKTLTAMWTGDSYNVILNRSDSSAGTVSGSGSHSYTSSVTITATTNSGYTWIGWYDADDELITTELSYTFEMPTKNVTFTAKYELDDAMANFIFTSTASTCAITGIIDNTVTEITVPDYVTSISIGAFSGCSSLVSITLPFVGSSASKTSASSSTLFGYIFGTSNYTSSTSTTQIYGGSSSFSATYYIPTALITVVITGGNILYGAFYNCTNLTSITLSDSATSIGSCAFNNCTSLTSIIIPNNVTSIGYGAFYNCTNLTSITLSDSATSIGSCAFNNCTSLTSIIIPNNVTSIGNRAFHDCTSLMTVTIGSGVTAIDNYAFYGCKRLTKINFNAIAMDDLSSSNFVFAYTGQNSNGIMVTIGANVTKIPAYLFFPYNSSSYAPNITSVVFEDGSVCTSIGIYAFRYCTSLTSIAIPDSVTLTDDYAFYGCTSLTSVTIGSGVTSIGGYAFYDCTMLESVTIGESVTSIGSYAFYGCYKLVEVYNISSLTISAGSTNNGFVGYYAKNVNTSENGSSYLTTQDDYTFYNDDGTYYLMGYTGSKTELTLPTLTVNGEKVNYSIYQYAFYKNTKITSVIIPGNVTSIGAFAFSGCTSLTSVAFVNRSGWYVTKTYGTTSGTTILSSDLSNSSTAATYLTSTYNSYYWKRSGS